MKNSKMMKILICIFLVVEIVVSNVSVAYAAPYLEKDEIRSVLYQDLESLNSKLNNAYTNTQGLLYNLNTISKILSVLHYMDEDVVLGFSEDQISLYKENLFLYMRRFNEAFGSSTDYVVRPFSFSLTADSSSMTSATLQSYLDSIAGYVDSILSVHSSSITGMTDTEKKSYIKSNAVEIRYVYATIMGVYNMNLELSSLIPDEHMPPDIVSYNPRIKINPWITIMTNQAYELILNEGKALNTGSVEEMLAIEVNDAETFKDVFLNSDNTFTTGYMAILASSAVYRPFKSIVGDNDFLSSLRSMTSDQKVISMYEKIKNRRKPLYYREGDDGVGKGNARAITIQDFISLIEEENTGYLVTVNGQFRKQKDTDAFGYYNGSAGEVEVNLEGTETSKPNTGGETETKTEVETTNQFISHSSEITEESMMTSPIFGFGDGSKKQSTAQVLMYNIIKDIKNLDGMTHLDKRYLYVNIFGDIVTDNNVVIVPGIANPFLYDKSSGYYPYTLAFMSSYPKVNLNTSEFKLNSKRDVEKYVIAQQNKANRDVLSIYDTNWEADMYPKALKTTSTKKVKFKFDSLDVLPLITTMYNDRMEEISFIQVMSKTADRNIGNLWGFTAGLDGFSIDGTKANFYLQDTNKNIEFDTPVDAFSYEGLESNSKVPAFLGDLALKSLLLTETGATKEGNGRLSTKYVIANVFLTALNGLDDVSTFSKNSIADYETFIEDNSSKLDKTISGLFKPLIESLTKVDGVIGLKSAYQNPVFGKFLLFCENYLIYILIFVVVFFIIKYVRQSSQFFYTIFISILSVLFTFLFLRIIPIYIPSFYNLVVSNMSETVSYSALLMKVEKYNTVYNLKDDVTPDGRFSMSASSLDVYHLKDSEFNDLISQYDIEKDKILSGEAYILDENIGLYLEGKTLKVNIDRLYATLSITGKYNNIDGFATYQLSSEKRVSNVIDYYTPYYQIIDSFISRLNDLNMVYTIPKSSLFYGQGLYKDSFMVSSYMNSAVFLSPDDLGEEVALLDPYVADKLTSLFENNTDFLGLTNLLTDDISYGDTLWYKTLKQNGYIGDNDKLWDLISTVNFQTKKFMLDNLGQMEYISDENLIKTIAIFALTTFNQQAGTFNNMLYPTSLNYEEIDMEDVFLPILTSEYDRYISQNMNITNYVQGEYRWFGIILFFIISLLSFLIVNVVNYAVPVMYILLLAVFFVRFIAKSTGMVIVKNYIKISAIIFACYSLFGIATIFSRKINTSILVLILLAVVYLAIATVLFGTCFAVITNISDLGGDKVNYFLKGILDKTKLSAVGNKLKVTTTNILNKEVPSELLGDNRDSRYERYRYNGSDDMLIDDGRVVNRTVNYSTKTPVISSDDYEEMLEVDRKSSRRRSRRRYSSSSENMNFEDYRL